jgi:hypothetical protein
MGSRGPSQCSIAAPRVTPSLAAYRSMFASSAASTLMLIFTLPTVMLTIRPSVATFPSCAAGAIWQSGRPELSKTFAS